ncbi:hypothetical protein ACQKCH_14685 [Nubsella zeaxanthinifaciens]|uniref:hypothetical protein n=1 Tax=Nubsella zeaxanthinifaciens TaxID=392412 RepID=UPI003D001698
MNQKDKRISIKEMNEELTNPNKKENVIYTYDTDATVRSLTFTSLNDDRQTFYYHNLITHRYLSEEDTLQLTFTSGIFELKGRNLIKLDKLLSKYLVREIFIVEERYIQANGLDDTDIIIISFKEINL